MNGPRLFAYRKSLIAIALGLAACASAVSSTSEPAELTVERLPDQGNPGERGSITGIVRDRHSHDPLEALVILQCKCLSGDRETVANAEGLYAFRELPRGTYTIHVLYRDHDFTTSVSLPAGVRYRVNFSLLQNSHVLT